MSVDRDQELLVFLRSHLGIEGLDYLVPPRRFPQGMFSDVLSFRLNRGPAEWSVPLVLRMLPLDAAPEQPALETAVQNGLARIQWPAPRVLLGHDRIDPLGRMFTVMEQCPGRPSLKGVRWDLFAQDLPRLAISWPATLARIARDLHACATGPVLDEAESRGLRRDQLSPERHLRFVEDRLSRFGGHAATGALGWLREFDPGHSGVESVLHGDLWPANVLRSGGRLTGMVDWERAAVGDPALDIGFAKVGLALLPAPAQVPAPIRQLVNAAGRSMATRLEDEYRKLSSLSPERVKYYEALRCALELAVVLERQHSSAVTGQPGWLQGVGALAGHFADVTGVPLHLDIAN